MDTDARRSPSQPADPAAPPRRRSQEERSEATRGLLLEAAIDILLEQGYRRCTVVEICRRAGVTTGALQHHYGAKNHLMAEIIDRLFPGIELWTPADPPADDDLRDRCRRLVDAYWDIYRNPRYMAVWEVVVGSRSEPEVYDLVLQHQRAATRAAEERFRRLFADTGLSRRELADLCQFVTSELRGIALLRMFGDAVERRTGQVELLKDAIHQKLKRGPGA
ncbi:MAG: TetR/AcrR family transcriptional regulator [Hyphomicrobiales bacterium]|nr:TetR/AcrR family transcriptional regulator [Hyphomicrobiales bacterium]MCP5373332.1 TetR/AcrR family transcriptional regulator [Hyphomicrobiales bacterium]